jgi:hypothetical protein
LAAKHNISVEDANQLIEKVGTDRGSVDAAAQDLKTDSASSDQSSHD